MDKIIALIKQMLTAGLFTPYGGIEIKWEAKRIVNVKKIEGVDPKQFN